MYLIMRASCIQRFSPSLSGVDVPDGATHHKVLMQHRTTVLYTCFGMELLVFSLALKLGNWFFASFVSQIYWWTVVHYFWASLYIDPDLDQLGVTQADGRQMRLGVIGYFFFAYWTFYAAMMAMICHVFKIKGSFGSAHRSKLTHSVFPGTFIRVMFLDVPILFIVALVNAYVTIPLYFWLFNAVPLVVGQLIGLGVADYIHIWLDEHNGEEVM